MSISKRLRYEILRRDNHTCRYCGAAAPDVALTVDHVIPTTLGGSDDPGNLVAACHDCNAGKTSSNPDAPLVADVEQDAMRWAAAIKRVEAVQQRARDNVDEWLRWFHEEWHHWTYGPESEPHPLPHDWQTSIERMYLSGCTAEDFDYAIRTAMQSWALPENKFRYFAGVIWRVIEERQQIAKSLLQED